MEGLLFLVCVTLTTQLAFGLFPTVCVENITTSGVCCPAPEGFYEPCGGKGRGSCKPFPDDVNGDETDGRPLWRLLSRDNRLQWPTYFIKEGCQCEGNIYGYDCSQCFYGYTGENCTEKKKIIVRQNALNFMKDDVRRRRFIKALNQSKYEPSGYSVMNLTHEVDAVPRTEDLTFHPVSVYNMYIFSHVYSARSTRAADGTCIRLGNNIYHHTVDWSHAGPALLPFHRRWELGLERELQRISGDPDLAIPYWDYTKERDNNACSVCTADFLGETDPNDTEHHLLNSPFADWQMLCRPSKSNFCDTCDPTEEVGRVIRNPGGHRLVPTLPTQAEVEYTLSLPDFDLYPYNDLGNTSFVAMYDGTKQHFNSNQSTSMHAQVHLWLNGTMSDGVTTTPNDPIFTVTHSMLDMILERWIRRHKPTKHDYPGKKAPIGHAANDWLVPFYPPESNIAYFTRSEAFGYTYEGMEEDSEASASGATELSGDKQGTP